MIKLILFDLGGVVFTNGSKKFKKDLSARYNIPIKTVENVVDGELGTSYREGKISRDEFWRIVIPKLKLKKSVEELEKEWIDDYDLIEGTKQLILELRKKYKVMYLSDNVRERVERLNNRFGFISWFDGGIFSHDVGVRKPNPKIYELALQKAGVNASEAVFIDDKPKFLIPAKAMGMTTIVFESPSLLRLSLEKIHLL